MPKTWDDLVKVSQKLQKEGKVKWGYVGGMTFTNTFFSFWWSLWNNNCDVYAPAYERDNAVLSKNGWKPMTADACQVQTAEFWWDALHKNNISPPGMSTYSRDEANAIFQAGDAA
ncbi:MAG: ABC transporter substrate-binding protein, partial [Rhizobiales bacterium 35-66-30]